MDLVKYELRDGDNESNNEEENEDEIFVSIVDKPKGTLTISSYMNRDDYAIKKKHNEKLIYTQTPYDTIFHFRNRYIIPIATEVCNVIRLITYLPTSLDKNSSNKISLNELTKLLMQLDI
ncbi:hypothetical protein BDA99DRAFT_531193 [Phascolomyces articulosus]|uniref:EF-hand domain-containing protein n=1 Tax=Phascolomyces articulosus TaxID=60185 RepID=A0AAD5KQ62_9FUNG|nr:hypothetical protein BDA99DRAFT_531193 [Phascolomyces articulosus]